MYLRITFDNFGSILGAFWKHFGAFGGHFGVLGAQDGPKSAQECQNVDFGVM